MSFKDIKGHDNVLAVLKENIRRDRIFSTYLFVGPDGVGKHLTAKNFAKALNCVERKPEPCEVCISCKKINSKIHPDVFFVEPKGKSSSIGIDEIRDVIKCANLKPYEARKKVFIINDAHSMNVAASNAFLKTLEEPPRDNIFILISYSKEALLPTIVSRCHTVRFSAAPDSLVENVLMERFNISRDEAKILSNFSSGRIGEAIRLKEENLIERKNTLLNSLFDMNPAIRSYSNKEELKTNLEFIISYFRDVSLYKAIEDKGVLLNLDKIEEIKKQSRNFTQEDLGRLIEKIITLRSYVDYNVNPKLIVDVLTSEIASQ